MRKVGVDRHVFNYHKERFTEAPKEGRAVGKSGRIDLPLVMKLVEKLKHDGKKEGTKIDKKQQREAEEQVRTADKTQKSVVEDEEKHRLSKRQSRTSKTKSKEEQGQDEIVKTEGTMYEEKG